MFNNKNFKTILQLLHNLYGLNSLCVTFEKKIIFLNTLRSNLNKINKIK